VKLILGTAIAIVGAVGLAGCEPISDPGDHMSGMAMVNDLNIEVGLAPCETTSCDSLGGTVRYHLHPGERLGVNLTGDGVATYYRIDFPNGKSTCLRLSIKDRRPYSTVPLSEARPCG
jgi:hypothetical protein